MTTLTNHGRERLLERTKLSETEVLAALRVGKTVLLGLNPGGRLQLRFIYSPQDENFFVLPIDIIRDRVCTVLPREMYSAQRRALTIAEHHVFDAKAKFVEPLLAVHPLSRQALRVQATGYFLSGAGQVNAFSLGNHICPSGLTSIGELGNNQEFVENLRDRVRARGLNPARLDSIYVRQGARDPIALPGIGPANPWATVGLFDVPCPVD